MFYTDNIPDTPKQNDFYCSVCKADIPSGGSHCILCGSNRLAIGHGHRRLPSMAPKNERGYFLFCPRCGNSEKQDEDSPYCRICGLPLKNSCLGNNATEKHHINPSAALFCGACGSKTRYSSLHKALPVLPSPGRYQEEYENDSEWKMIRCPVCHKTTESDYGTNCPACDTPLFNECRESSLIRKIFLRKRSTIHKNAGNARYCETCGKETLFYQSLYLQDYEDCPDHKKPE